MIFRMIRPPRMITKIARKYIDVPTQTLSPKNTPAKRAMIGSFAPHGMKGASKAVVLRCRSFLIVLVAMTPGIAHPVLTIMGMIDFPESPIFLKYGSITSATRAMYPLSSRRASMKNSTMIKGRNPTTAPTPPMIPSSSSEESTGCTFSPRTDSTNS